VHIAVTLRMHEEASYEGLDPIETEVRRRVFWLLFGGRSTHFLSPVFNISESCIVDAPWGRIAADKSMSILLGRPICLRDEDCTLHFPKEVDDE